MTVLRSATQEIDPCLYFSVSCDAYHGCPMGKCDGEQPFIDMKIGQLHELLGGTYGNFTYDTAFALCIPLPSQLNHCHCLVCSTAFCGLDTAFALCVPLPS